MNSIFKILKKKNDEDANRVWSSKRKLDNEEPIPNSKVKNVQGWNANSWDKMPT